MNPLFPGAQVRPYTPTSLDNGYLELVVKAYDQAKMSRHLHALEPGTGSVEMFGPVGSLKWARTFVAHTRATESRSLSRSVSIYPLLSLSHRATPIFVFA